MACGTGGEAVVSFWVEEVGAENWYRSDPALDARIRARWEETWQQARAGGLMQWLTRPRSALGYIILTDQFPRNMFRGRAEAFATDVLARDAALMAVGRDFDEAIDGPERHFFYMPMMHSESLTDQERAIRWFLLRMGEAADNLLHARVHREIIRRYGRFPYRNEALGRKTRPAEAAFLAGPGYGGILQELSA